MFIKLTSHSASLGLFFHLSWSQVSLPPGDTGAVKSLNTDCRERNAIQNAEPLLGHADDSAGKSASRASLRTWVWSQNPCEKLDLAEYTNNPTTAMITWEAETWKLSGSSQTSYGLLQQKEERPCFNKIEGKKWFSKDVFWPLPVHCGMLISAPKISNKEILFIKILEISIKNKNKKVKPGPIKNRLISVKSDDFSSIPRTHMIGENQLVS